MEGDTLAVTVTEGASLRNETETTNTIQKLPKNASADARIPESPVETVIDRITNDNLTFAEEITQYQLKLENEFSLFADSLTLRVPDDELKVMNWDDLERRYDHEMGLKIAAEHDIMNEFSARFKQFMLWMQVSNEKEAERAMKRLRTRVAFVQNSEDQLGTKQEHYAKVLAAFQDAMALLGNL